MVITRNLVLKADRKNAPYASLLALAASGFSLEESVQFVDGQKLVLNLDGEVLSNDVEIARIISQSTASADRLLGTSVVDFVVVDNITNIVAEAVNKNDFSELMKKDFPTSIFDNLLTVADFAIFSVAHNNPQLKTKFTGIVDRILKDSSLASAHNLVGLYKVAAAPSKNVASVGKEKKKDEGKFVELPGAEKGKVVVRFPPEASGYLHIGHAKAALLNQYYQQEFEGQLIMRFDDTNPAKENAHFEHVIKEDLAMLNIVPDRWTHSSDHFEMLLTMCEKLLKEGKAFVDDTDTETMRKEREDRQDSRNRSNTPEKNLQLWEEMKKGTERGLTCCVRIKIDMKSNNGAMRDPTIYRCKPEEHVRTGLKYKVYPTYDFTCPIVDSVEGVTHALRTTEYHDRDDQYYFICDQLGLRRPYIWEYARLNMTNTVMSKRKLTWFVDEGHVEGWDDPRLPTVRGVMRRGLTVDGLKQFIVAQGGSRSVVMMEWDKIWAFNKKVIDPVAPRYTALETTTPLVLVELTDSIEDDISSVSLHPKNAEIGNKDVHKGKKLFLEQVDASALKEGEIVTFVNWGNIKLGKIEKKGNVITKITATLQLENTDYKKTTKVTWLGVVKAESGKTIPVVTAEYDHIISKAIIGKDEDWKQFINFDSVHYKKMVGEPAIQNVKKGDIIQLQRKGFYIVDQPYNKKSEISGAETPLLLIAIPDGHTGKEAEKTPKVPTATSATAASSGGSDALQLYSSIEEQGNLVRDLKAKDAKSQETKNAIAKLLDLKKKFKDVTGSDFKPGQPPAAASAPSISESTSGKSEALQIYTSIEEQGNLVRDLKAKDAKSQDTKNAIAKLLELKKKFKDVTGSDFKPGQPPAAAPAVSGSNNALNIYNQIEAQGNTVRDLKTKDAKSQATKDAIAKLLELKKQYKDATGADYKPGSAPSSASAGAPKPAVDGAKIAQQIEEQGNLVRELKTKDAKSQETKDAIAKLLEFKKQYKEVTGADYKPGTVPAPTPASVEAAVPIPVADGTTVAKNIEEQGNLVRELKTKDAKSQATKDAISKLLELKKQYKDLTGSDYKPGGAPATPAQAPAASPSSAAFDETALLKEIDEQAVIVREAKAKDPKSQESADAINKLLSLKANFKKVTGKDVPAPANAQNKKGKKK
ncbi:CRE-EARS-1 protein [Caenorhabditis remanei]|uniref:glutamate--tRNA ligase n=1 Tax=Caenorhabditis remanei TaxID=31234 RepID=E3LUW3_CAERE|nr:CRE-EARS-1 protein [Caenorhabditis remanei]